MDGDRKINISEGVPLNASGAAKIYMNTGNNTKVNSPNGTVIHLQTEKRSPADVDLHINTTFSIASSRKIKLLFVLNFLLSILCMAMSCSVAFYYWSELSAIRAQLDAVKDQLIMYNLQGLGPRQDPVQADALVSFPRPQLRPRDREARMDGDKIPNTKKFYVEDLGDDMLFVDSRKKSPDSNRVPEDKLPFVPPQRDLLVAHFNGAMNEVNLGTKAIVGPWYRDADISSKHSEDKIELTNYEYVTIKEDGLYLIYAQVVYLSHAPNSYFIFARQNQSNDKSRLLTSCATGDDSSKRPLINSQLSCSVQTVARLYKGDIVNIAQREQNRTLWLRPGYTYFGFIKLSS
ncbi:unnamed protein product [Plutella xylostella]|uniref:(diamondback moth) hypothetical protein n=1 Tax=Plutella xylostella TaxID=51655 RepID=A0A8S4G481_PLUXY|nr:unnamed protein product [Plutella xylostella]